MTTTQQLTAAVHFTVGGTVYHTTPTCRALESGQALNDWDCAEFPCDHGHAVQRQPLPEALNRGKLPCVTCVPTNLRAFPPLYGQTFGHRPFNEYTKPGASRIVCARCMIWTRWSDVGLSVGVRVAWPCTTAVILGLAVREVA